jgi:hypothetical protein
MWRRALAHSRVSKSGGGGNERAGGRAQLFQAKLVECEREIYCTEDVILDWT